MFESVTEAEKREGFGGFVARHFGAVVDEELAREGIRDVAIVLLILWGITGVRGWYLFGPSALIVAIVLGIPAVILRFIPSRVAASVLLALAVANALLSFPAILPCVWVLFALRGVQLTFGYHRLRRKASAPRTPPAMPTH